MNTFRMHRLGMIMEPEPGNPLEVLGVLNPGAVRGPDGQLYLFPRMVAAGNYSRIGISRVLFNEKGDPIGVERLGIALEPEAEYEIRPGGGGGCEDPRVTFVVPLQRYVMTYTAFGPAGPRVAIAISEDLFHWQRLGLATFRPYHDVDFDGVDNKDASVFPMAIPNPNGHASMAVINRPLFPGTNAVDTLRKEDDHLVDFHRESIWISYCATAIKDASHYHLAHFGSHRRLASPVAPWERLKIGGGAPPVLSRHGWLLLYHGVGEVKSQDKNNHQLEYSAGLMILSKEQPDVILYRSPRPVLTPKLQAEREGTISEVVFPTGVDQRTDLDMPDRYDVYYGMADDRIGVARLDVPPEIPEGAPADLEGAPGDQHSEGKGK